MARRRLLVLVVWYASLALTAAWSGQFHFAAPSSSLLARSVGGRRHLISLRTSSSLRVTMSDVGDQERGDRRSAQHGGALCRRNFLEQYCTGASLICVLSAPSSCSAATVAWPGADGGRVKTTARAQPPAVSAATPPTTAAASPDGREQLARSEPDLSLISYADLPKGEQGVHEGVR
jgi:hypothetical protein